jgi:hypothetical protein
MGVLSIVRKLWWRKKKVTWTMRAVGLLSRSRLLAIFGGAVALLGGAREARKRLARG